MRTISPGPAVLDRERNRLGAVGLDGERRLAALQSGQRVVDDRHRVLAARIVGGEDDEIAAAPGGFAHQRALGAIAIAAAAEDGDHLAAAAGNEFAGKRGEIAQRVVGVGVIHHHGEGLAGVHALEASGHAGQPLNPAGNGFRRAVARERRSGRGEDVVDVDAPDERRPERNRARGCHQVKARAVHADVNFARHGNRLAPAPYVSTCERGLLNFASFFPYSSSMLTTATRGGSVPMPSNSARLAAK